MENGCFKSNFSFAQIDPTCCVLSLSCKILLLKYLTPLPIAGLNTSSNFIPEGGLGTVLSEGLSGGLTVDLGSPDCESD